MTEKWYQLAFHLTTTCFLSDYSFRQDIRALSAAEFAELIYFVCLAVNATEGSTPFVIKFY
jgi:hypothetical protein